MKVIFPPETESAAVAAPSSANVGLAELTRKCFWWLRPALKQFLQVVLVAFLAVCSYYFMSRHVLQNVEVVGVSMVPTLHNADHLLLNHWTYLFRQPKRNDIVVLRDPSDNTFAVKRIVAGAGDSIYLKGGRVYINGTLLDEPYLAPGTPTYSYLTRKGDQLTVCGKDRYFVLGDNRKNSADSRVYGAIPRANILGTVIR